MRVPSSLLALCAIALSGVVSAVELQTWPGLPQDNAALQSGALTFVRHCLACHGITSADRERLEAADFADESIRLELQAFMLGREEHLRAVAEPKVLKQAFGASPPDLAAYLRSRHSAQGSSADWAYTFLLSFQPDANSGTGWNNTLVPGVRMPHVLYGLPEMAQKESRKPKEYGPFRKAGQDKFDKRVSDLVAYLVWVSGSGQKFGHGASGSAERAGFVVLAFLAVLLALVYVLKKSYWQGVR
ncbi:MAG: Cytochrome C1 family protein [Betaproteobacteria bacterium ADurb.Bin341]|nr:MAG: Cytochrome C1 family protein [Betaproteobacteria bacterium ADurb.Bin341]